MKTSHSYLVRIYRREPEALTGWVEEVRTSRTAVFRSFDELGDLLAGRKRFGRRPGRRTDPVGFAPSAAAEAAPPDLTTLP